MNSPVQHTDLDVIADAWNTLSQHMMDKSLKQCTGCLEWKDAHADFYKNSRIKSTGIDPRCKICTSKEGKEWRAKNPEKFKSRQKISYQRNKVSNRLRNQEYYAKHREEKSVYDAGYREKKRKEIAEYKKQWWNKKKHEVELRIKHNLRRRVHHVLKGYEKADRTLALIGCDAEEFKIHIENQFDSKMSWDNYGREGWHIDHIIPCYTFDLSDPEQQKVCFHFSNQRPLWGKINMGRCRPGYIESVTKRRERISSSV